VSVGSYSYQSSSESRADLWTFGARAYADCIAGTLSQNNDKWEPESWPKTAKGFGMVEAPRGALSHFIVIEDKKIENYQLVVPTTWNAAPRDLEGKRSAFEESLIGTPVADPKVPLEVIRTIHSFDPCLACAVHVYDENGSHVHELKTY
jgi:hydrogenase large subunit